MSRMKTSLALFALLCCVQQALAENADRNKPINLDADQVTVDDGRHISTFTGNVRLSQGTLLITGDKIIVEQTVDGFKKMTAFGQTADFRQKQEGLDSYVEGHGERIEYDSARELVDIYGQASIKRGQDEVQGKHITYNIGTEIFKVEGDSSPASEGEPSQRVRAVLQPARSRGTVKQPAPTQPLPFTSPQQEQHE